MKRECIHVGDVELEFHETGEGAPLLFLHGARGFFPEDEYVKVLAQGRRLIAPSHPGFGNSSLPDWIDRVDDYAQVYLALLDVLGVDRVDLVGCSIGGWIAAEMGTMAPERINRLVLVSPVGVKVGRVDRLDVPDIFAMSQDELARLFFNDPAKGRLDPSALSDEQLRVMVRNRETLTLISWEPYMHNPKLKHRLHRLNAPSLFLRGANDRFVSAEYLDAYARLLPNASLDTVPDAGHELVAERPDLFAARVQAFLAGTEAPRSNVESAR